MPKSSAKPTSKSTSMPKHIELPLPSSGKIEHIYHVSDIHIRTGDNDKSRADEYLQVFQNLAKKLNSKKFQKYNDSAVVVVTGDIFHHKCKIEASGLYLFNFLMTKLAEIAPVYVIQGNHDYRQDQHDMPDMLTAAFEGNINPNICYLHDSAHYVANNIGFGLISVKETLVEGGTSGKVETLPQFPDPSKFPSSVKTKIALFHGTVRNATLQNYTKSNEEADYPLEWFNGYDGCMLGDIHLQQVNNATFNSKTKSYKPITKNKKSQSQSPLWAYSGSLIQQNFGETLYGHGFLHWKFDSKSSDYEIQQYHIDNPFGFVTVTNEKNKWYWIEKGKTPLKELLSNTTTKKSKTSKTTIKSEYPPFPTNIYLRLTGKYVDITSLHKLFQKHGVTYTISNTLYSLQNKTITQKSNSSDTVPTSDTSDNTSSKSDNTHLDIHSFNSEDTWIKYIEQHLDRSKIKSKTSTNEWKKWFKSYDELKIPVKDLPIPEYVKKMAEGRNDKIQKEIDLMRETISEQHKTNDVLGLEYMEWQWVLCFRDNCYYDFKHMDGNIAILNAENGHGKSSFVETICLALFGESMPSRSNKNHSSSIICRQKPTGTNSQIFLRFHIGKETYLIQRIFVENANDRNRLTKSVAIYQKNQSKTDTLTTTTTTKETKTTSTKETKSTKKQTSKTQITPDWLLLHSGNTAVDAWIKTKIGNLDSFLMSCMLTQNSDNDFFNMRPHEQTDFFDQALNLNSVNRLANMMKQTKLAYDFIIGHLHTVNETNGKNLPEIDTKKLKQIEEEYNELKAHKKKLEKKTNNIKEVWHDFEEDELLMKEKQIEKEIKKHKTILKKMERERQLVASLSLFDQNQLLEKKGFLKSQINSIEDPLDDEDDDSNPKLQSQITGNSEYYKKSINDLESLLKSLKSNPIQIPENTEKEIETESWQIKKWNEKWQGYDFDDKNTTKIIKKTKKENEKHHQELDETKSNLKKLMEPSNIPQPGNPKSNDTSKINKKLKKIINEIDQKYGSTSNIQDMIKQNPLKHNVMTNDMIDKVEERLVSEIKKMGQTCHTLFTIQNNKSKHQDLVNSITIRHGYYESDLKSLNSKMELLKSEIEKMDNEMESKKTTLISLRKDSHHKHGNNQVTPEDYDPYVTNITSAIDKDPESITEFITHADKLKKFHSKVLKTHQTTKKEHELEKEIHELTDENIALRKEISPLQSKIDQLPRQYLSEIQKFREYQNYVQHISEWNKRVQDITNQRKDAEMNESLKVMHQLHDSYLEYQREINEHQKNEAYQKWEDDINGLKHIIEILEIKIAKNDSLINKYELWEEESKEWLPRIEKHTQNQEQLQKWLPWNDKVNTVQECIYRKQLEEIEKQLSYFTHVDELNDSITKLEKLLEVKPLWEKKSKLQKQLRKVTSSFEEKTLEYNQFKRYHDESEASLEAISKLNKIINKFVNKRDLIVHIAELFENYRQWIYSQKILPHITHNINNIISHVTSTGLKLSGKMTESKRFTWMISDGTNQIIIEKASGFQKFIIGLAMRICMSSIGASSIKCRQLFIDEGFTACDSKHLRMVPQFMNGLLGTYDSILLVSHLDDVKECATQEIKLERDTSKNLSRLKFGQQQVINVKRANVNRKK